MNINIDYLRPLLLIARAYEGRDPWRGDAQEAAANPGYLHWEGVRCPSGAVNDWGESFYRTITLYCADSKGNVSHIVVHECTLSDALYVVTEAYRALLTGEE